nr:hypothetical protein BaRGS_010086 [Batillaria attramentaria]
MLSVNKVQDCAGLSDHYLLVCGLSLTRPPPLTRLVTSRDLKAVNPVDFQSDVKSLASSVAIVNSSLSTGLVPSQFKKAVDTPLLKKPASLVTFIPSRTLRSSSERLLKIPKRNLKSFVLDLKTFCILQTMMMDDEWDEDWTEDLKLELQEPSVTILVMASLMKMMKMMMLMMTEVEKEMI